MTAALGAAIVAAYLSLAVEIFVLRVPSVASSRAILRADATLVAGYSARYQRLFRLSLPVKSILFVVPLALVYVVYAFPLAVAWAGADPLGDYVFAPTPAARGVAIVLIVLGRMLSFGYLLSIARRRRADGEAAALCTTGLFRWSRNPGLVGAYVLVTGLWVGMPSSTLLILIALYAAYMDFKIRMEEDFLTNRFGREYAEYRRATGRYVR